jgi:hypothetical protein
MPPRSLATGADDDAESAAHPVVAEARHGLDVVVEKDDQRERRPAGSALLLSGEA